MNGVSMIPFGILGGYVNGLEVRITNLAVEGFTFRTAETLGPLKEIQMVFYIHQEYRKITVTAYDIASVQTTDFYTLYTILVKDAAYERNANQLIQEYSHYITWQLEGRTSQEMTGYPLEKDGQFWEVFLEEKHKWFSGIEEQVIYEEVEMGVQIGEIEEFLENGIEKYWRKILEENGLEHHSLRKVTPKRIYIGSEFCHHRLPDKDQLEKVLEKAREEELFVTMAFPYVREDRVEEGKEYLVFLNAYANKHHQKMEVLVNDWGMLSMIKDHCFLQPVLGVLLNRRRKDPRQDYKIGFSKDVLRENNLNEREYQQYLKERLGVQTYEFESCGYPIKIPPGDHILRFPFYQTNTSQYCPLYAYCVYGDRGHQGEVKTCPKFCKEKVFAYPQHLKMVGRYNSIFALDDSLLREQKTLDNYVKQGIHRMVLDLL